ncbi:MAG: hypothetical protein [Olavius algarvensis Gamma 3 endosymbiont]|nr:MAG: hypothetical protein [Olavius algarvensis Gamma 3 endosymbiont]
MSDRRSLCPKIDSHRPVSIIGFFFLIEINFAAKRYLHL